MPPARRLPPNGGFLSRPVSACCNAPWGFRHAPGIQPSAGPEARHPPRRRRSPDADSLKAALPPIIAQAGGVLSDQKLPPAHPLQQSRPGGGHHLRRGYARVVQEPIEPNLARPVAAQSAQTDPARAGTQQPFQKKDPPFSSRPSPNRPRPVIIANHPLLSGDSESNITGGRKGKIIPDLCGGGRVEPEDDGQSQVIA